MDVEEILKKPEYRRLKSCLLPPEKEEKKAESDGKRLRRGVMIFKNVANGYEMDLTDPLAWALLFGPFYFMKHVPIHAAASFIIAIFTGGISWFVYPFFARDIIRREYMSKGWIEVSDRAGDCPNSGFQLAGAGSIPKAPSQVPKERSTSTIMTGALVVIGVVIASLGSWAVLKGPGFFSESGPAMEAIDVKRQLAARETMQLLSQALDQFHLNVGRYPTTKEGLSALTTNPGGLANWDGPYLKRGLPNDPWGKPYGYECPGNSGEFDIYSYGRDGTPGGEGVDRDVTSWD